MFCAARDEYYTCDYFIHIHCYYGCHNIWLLNVKIFLATFIIKDINKSVELVEPDINKLVKSVEPVEPNINESVKSVKPVEPNINKFD